MELFAADGHDAGGCERVTGKSGMRPPWGNQWLKVQLVGEGGRAGHFERGISQHPTIINRVIGCLTADR